MAKIKMTKRSIGRTERRSKKTQNSVKLSPALRKKVERVFKAARSRPYLPPDTKVVKKGSYLGRNYVVLDTRDPHKTYLGVILETKDHPGWFANGWDRSSVLTYLFAYLDKTPNPANQQNLLIGALAAFAGYKFTKTKG